MPKIDAFLRTMIEKGGSDLHLCSCMKPKIRVHGQLQPLDVPEISPAEMKDVLMFYLDSCGYCDKARRALDELFAENPAYREIPLTRIEESEQPELADRYDYYAVPSFFAPPGLSSFLHFFIPSFLHSFKVPTGCSAGGRGR